MLQHTIQVSDTIYQLLLKEAVKEKSTPEQVTERLLTQGLTFNIEPNKTIPSSSNDVTEALAAVERLTTLFADVKINGLEQLLDDPMLELANADLDIELL